MEYPPAKNPYKIENTYNGATEEDKPQITKTETNEPILETASTFVTANLSERYPRRIWPATEEALRAESVSEPARVEDPIEWA